MYPIKRIHTVEFYINLENRGRCRVTMLNLEQLNKSNVYSVLEKRHYSKSESQFIQLLQDERKYEETVQNEFFRANENLIKLGEIVEILPFAEAFQALISTAYSTLFYSVRSAEIRTLKQRMRYHQIRLEYKAWCIQYYKEKLHDFEISKKRLKTFIKRGYF